MKIVIVIGGRDSEDDLNKFADKSGKIVYEILICLVLIKKSLTADNF